MDEGDLPAECVESIIADTVLTRDLLESYGTPRTRTLLRLDGYQVAKGLRRGLLVVGDFGDFRAVYFDGESYDGDIC